MGLIVHKNPVNPQILKILILTKYTNTLFPIFVQPFTHTGNKNSAKTKNE
ncbi:hypothetical protein SAMN05444128_1576 [Pontibacter indicus]|uniref:Uncharacterized protein n=1 Tax=Pontibacter indicus TaxID=1317125 RepID=A0A1R3X4U0_9BACT|nr:hypothetical protein SAMN05444128_1576 [Pontibacter indicus]